MEAAGAGLLALEERGAYLDAFGAERQSGDNAARVADAAGGDDRHRDAITIRGTSDIVPVRESSEPEERTAMPPASKPEAAMASTPACSSAAASSGVVAVPIVTIPFALHSSRTSAGGTPKMKLMTGTFASSSTRTWSSKRAG